ncbi:MAG: hypothetical protein WKF70_03240, partial [Chitinophagaceae bacterium]
KIYAAYANASMQHDYDLANLLYTDRQYDATIQTKKLLVRRMLLSIYIPIKHFYVGNYSKS